MARKRVAFRRIENERARKASLKKKSTFVIKKLSELCILCAATACVIINSPDNDEPIIWPQRPEIEEILARFESIPHIVKYQKSTNYESFMKENINKLEEKLAKYLKEITRIEMNQMMVQIFNMGKQFIEFPISEVFALRDYILEQLKDLDKRISYLERSAGISGSSGSRQGQDAVQTVDEVPGETLGEDDGEKYENINNPTEYAGIENDASHWNQASSYQEMVPYEGGNTVNACGSYLGTITSHDLASNFHVGGAPTLGFHPESLLGGSDSSMMATFGRGIGDGTEGASGRIRASASYGAEQVMTIGGNINTSQSEDTFPFLKGWGLTGGYVTGGLHDVVLGHRGMIRGSISGPGKASTPPCALGVDGNKTRGAINETSGGGSNAGAMK